MKLLITRRRFERVVIRQHKLNDNNLSCVACDGESPMMAIEQTGSLYGISVRTVFRLLEIGQVHYAELPSGLLFVCTASLGAELQKPKQ